MKLMGAVTALVLLAGCTASPEAAKTDSCEVAPQAVLDAIGSGAQDVTGMKVKAGQMYKSPDYAKVYFVAVTFSASGVADQVGVWSTNDPTGAGSVLAVDGTAKQFTTWPDAAKTDAKISSADPSVATVKGCLS